MIERLRLRNLAFCLGLVGTIPGIAQTSSHEEEIVRNTYAKITMLSSLGVVTDWVSSTRLDGKKDDAASLKDKMTAATPVFTLSDFRVGPISEIMNQKYGQFIVEPGTEVLDGTTMLYNEDDYGYKTHWTFYRLAWRTSNEGGEIAQKMVDSITVSEALTMGERENWRSNTQTEPVTFTRYAAYTVNATFNGKSSGPHKAIFFFGTDAKGLPVVIPNDLISGTQLVWAVLQIPYDSSGILLSPMRENPAFRDWMNADVMPAESCSATSSHDFCCSKGRCGISPGDFNRDMATAIPSKGVTP